MSAGWQLPRGRLGAPLLLSSAGSSLQGPADGAGLPGPGQVPCLAAALAPQSALSRESWAGMRWLWVPLPLD